MSPRTPAYPSIKSSKDSAFSSLGHQYLDELVSGGGGGSNGGKRKRKYDKTVTREPNIVTTGKPTFINIADKTRATQGYDSGASTTPPTTTPAAIVTEPSRTPAPGRIIRPQKSSDAKQEDPGTSRSASLAKIKPFDYTR